MRTPSARAGLPVLVFLGLAALTLNGCHEETAPPNAQTPGPAAVQPAPVPPAPALSKNGVIYVAQGDDLVARPVPLQSTHPARDALGALCAIDGSPLPTGTRLRSMKIADGLATCDFSHELRDNFHGSETQEAQTLNAILQTLGQFSAIDRVQILIDGKPVDALSQLPIAGPLDVVRPDSVQQARR